MTTNHRPKPSNAAPNAKGPRQISLRALARELGVNHSSLSAAVHDGRLYRGVRVDAKGRVVVTDAAAAKTNWNDVHVPQIVEASRAIEAARAPFWDETLACHTTREDLFAERDALSVLVTAMTADALGGAGDRRTVAGLEKRIAGHLRDVAEIHGADEDVLSLAERELHAAIALLHEAAAAAEEDDIEDEP